MQQEYSRWERLAKAGDNSAALHGEQLAEVEHDAAKQIYFRTLRAEIGPAPLKVEVAKNLYEGLKGFPKDPNKAQRLLEDAVASGYPPAMVALAEMEARPTLGSADNAHAYSLLERAITLGEPAAAEKLKTLPTPCVTEINQIAVGSATPGFW